MVIIDIFYNYVYINQLLSWTLQNTETLVSILSHENIFFCHKYDTYYKIEISIFTDLQLP